MAIILETNNITIFGRKSIGGRILLLFYITTVEILGKFLDRITGYTG
jgi:hypothetical protein